MIDKKNKGGRPSKLTPATIERLIACAKAGNHRETCAVFAGVGMDTLRVWLMKGDPESAMYAGDGTKYARFRSQFLEAEHVAERVSVGRILSAGQDEPKLLMWYLERRWPARWGRRDRLRVDGPPQVPGLTDAPLDVTKLSDQELAQLEALLTKAGAGEANDGE